MSEKKIKAVALHYDEQSAPRVTAKGEGTIGQEIIAKAKNLNIPLVKDEKLVEILSQIKLHDEIPKPLYIAVAEVLALLYSINEDAQPKNKKK